MLNGMGGELRPISAVLLEESTGAQVRVWAMEQGAREEVDRTL